MLRALPTGETFDGPEEFTIAKADEPLLDHLTATTGSRPSSLSTQGS